MKPLWKTTIVIWSDYDPSGRMELEDLARQATSGDAYCSLQETVYVYDPDEDDNPPSDEFFFGSDDEEEEDEE